MSTLRIAFILLLSISSLKSHSEIINEIKILGLQNISRGTVLNYLPFEKGDDFAPNQTEVFVKALKDTNYFSKVSITQIDDSLIIEVIENPTIKYFDFLNYKEDAVLNTEIVNDIKDNFNLKVGQIYNQNKLTDLLDKLKNLYINSGYYNSSIKIKKSLDEKNRIGFELDISEGDASRISTMKISGNKHKNSEDLLKLFSIGEPDFFLLNYFTEKDKFDLKEFNSGIEKIITKYLEDGFLDFQIANKEVLLNKDNSLSINIEVQEGERYKIRNIDISGSLLNYSNSYLSSFIDVKSGDFLDRKKILRNIEDLKNFYKKDGYGFTAINVKVTPTEVKSIVNIEIIIDPGKKIFIDRINISGNNKTQDDVIRRELVTNESQIFISEELEKSIKQVKRLGYFSSVTKDVKRHKVNDDKVDIDINVIEAKTGEVSVGLSHSNAAGASVNAGIKQKNILGTGNTFNLAFSNSSAVEEISLFYSTPYYDNKKQKVSFGFFDKTLDAANIEASSYLLNESGLVLGYGYKLDETSDLYSEIRGSSVDINCGSDLLVYEATDCSSKNNFDLNLSFILTDNTLNDYFYPTDGNETSAKVTIGIPYSDYKYYKFLGSHREYHEINDEYTLKLSSRVNYATGYGGDSLPFYKRFYEGGSSSVRGFDFNSLGPRYSNSKPKGGEISFVSSSSVSTPFKNIFNTENENMYLGAFIDAGTLAEKVSNFSLGDLRASSGLQFSWVTPIGPISLFYATPIIKKDDDLTQNLSFQLGASF